MRLKEEELIGIEQYEHDFHSLEYSSRFDDYLNNELGYEFLEQASSDLFLTPYSITSTREYYAEAFEMFLFGDIRTVQSVCPYLYHKIEELYRLYDE